MKKDGDHWFWLCTRPVNGVKCNMDKNSIRTGTVFWEQSSQYTRNSADILAFRASLV